MAHGRRRHIVPGACRRKVAYTTYEAAASAGAKVDAERVYRGSCCGWFHYTRYTEDEYAQRVAEYMDLEGVQTAADGGMMVTTDEEVHHAKQTDQPAAAAAGPQRAQPRARSGGPGDAVQQRGTSPRPAPSPAEVARRLQARSA